MKLSTIQKRENLNEVHAKGTKGNGGAFHVYHIYNPDNKCVDGEMALLNEVKFQDGARKLHDSIHGVLDTDLLEIVRHRLQCFQAGEFASEYNAKALEHVELALMYMNRRVEGRIERNVLGTNNK